MFSTVARKTFSTTLVVEQFSQQTEYKDVDLKIENISDNYFGIRHNAVIFEKEFVFAYLTNYVDSFKFIANVSILHSGDEKVFTKEFRGEFDEENYEIHFGLMSRSRILSPEFLDNDKLTLLCEIEVIEEDDQKITDTIRKDFSNLSENFQSLFTDGKFTDFTLVVGKDGKEFHVHKAILAARSSVFAAMFEHDCEEKRQNKVNITDIDEEVCAEMMSYIYTGKVKELDRFAMELLEAAVKYQMDSLKSLCEQYLSSNLSIETASNVLILADLHRANGLKTKCIHFISNNSDKVKDTERWKVLNTSSNYKLLAKLFLYSSSRSK